MKIFAKTSHSAKHQKGSPSLEINDVSFSYGGSTVLQNITLQLFGGQRVAVIGPNGAGKSTLFKIIAGVLTPNSGYIQLFGGQGPNSHICIAYLPQRSQVDWNFPVTVADVVLMGRTGKLGWFHKPTKADRDFVNDCLNSVHMDKLANRQINELSGGQQQRMFIARALAQEAEMILMDEPLNGLDSPSQNIIFGLLDTLQQKNITVMVATHDFDLASDRFNSILLLNRRVIGFGKASDVFTPDHLLEAYGGHIHTMNINGNLTTLGDTCCDDEYH